jgi:hypothetical protein
VRVPALMVCVRCVGTTPSAAASTGRLTTMSTHLLLARARDTGRVPSGTAGTKPCSGSSSQQQCCLLVGLGLAGVVQCFCVMTLSVKCPGFELCGRCWSQQRLAQLGRLRADWKQELTALRQGLTALQHACNALQHWAM